LKNRGIFFKIIALLLTVSILPLSLLAFFLNKISKDSIRESVSSGFQNISQRTAEEIQIFISGTENIISTASEIVVSTYPDKWKLKLTLRNLVQGIDGFESMEFFDKEGRNILSTNPKGETLNYSGEEFFKKAVNGTISYSDIYISDTLMPSMKISSPVLKLNQIVGVLVAEISVRYLWEVVNNIKIGETGHAYIVDKYGTVIAHSQIERVIKHENFSHIPIIKKLLKTGPLTDEYADENGLRVLGSGTIVRNLGWGIVVEQSAKEAFSLVRKINSITIVLLIVAVFTVTLIGILRARKIVAPIKQLIHRARKVALGDLSGSIDVSTNDEIGELADSFNTMTSSLKDAQERLIQNERLAILGRISSIIAHEIRNPLEAIKGASVYLKDKYTEDEAIKKFSGIIIQESENLNNFVTEILNSTREIRLEFMTTNINAILKNTCQLISKDSRFEKIKIVKEFDKTIPNSLLDPEYLQMAFLNILINSMQAISEGGEIKIRTKKRVLSDNDNSNLSATEQKKEYIETSVQDNGNGISDEIKAEIFKPFFTTKKSGSGLGLSHSYEIIRQHHGNLDLESKKGQGTNIIVQLPLIQSNQ